MYGRSFEVERQTVEWHLKLIRIGGSWSESPKHRITSRYSNWILRVLNLCEDYVDTYLFVGKQHFEFACLLLHVFSTLLCFELRQKLQEVPSISFPGSIQSPTIDLHNQRGRRKIE